MGGGSGRDTHDVREFVFAASLGSDVRISLSPSSAVFRLWLIMNIWSAVASGPAIRSTLQGKFGSVTLNGGSQI
jgi:hypothetical protein